jgi:3-phenylpropionate/trans-cinnamate dioxygenase ferredoxin reductase component
MTQSNEQPIVIVGASHAGAQTVDSLRREGYQGRIVLLGDEPYLPYQRPPLSKKFLLGELPLARLAIRQPAFYEQHQVEVRTNTRVTAITPPTRLLAFISDGQLGELHYDQLILCVGSRVRKLTCPGADLQGVHYVRTADDVIAMQAELAPGKRMVVIGAGYIGLETAASASKLGMDVTVLEMADRCLNRVTAPVVSAFYTQRHAQAGVRILVNTRVDALLGQEHVTAVRCADGTQIPADVVVVGVGIIPETAIAQAAGLHCDNGIVVDEHCRTSDPHIYAAGDCANHPSIRYGGRMRLESVDNALEQARVAASNICGKVVQHAHTPWFWSDQYDVKLQTAGLMQGHDQQIVRGDISTGQFSVWYLKSSELLAVDAINRPGDFMQGKKWISEHKHPDAIKLADANVDLKTIDVANSGTDGSLPTRQSIAQ